MKKRMNKQARYKRLKELTTKRDILQKKIGIINKEIFYKFKKRRTKEDALKRSYKVVTHSRGKNRVSCTINLPMCFTGKILKLKIVKK